MFIGREKEKNIINYLLSKDGFQSCIIYGRRRLGKTELIKHCLLNSSVKYIIYQCKESSEYDNANELSSLLSKELSITNLKFSSFMDAIRFVFEYSSSLKLALVIDEYPYIRELIDGCDSKLQEIIDTYSDKANLKLFVLGSSISTMEDVLGQNNPLYQRFTQSILLKQMDYYDSSKFYPSFSKEDKVKLFSAFGGVPFYNKQIDESQSVKENIIRLLSGSLSSFKEYNEYYLKSELRKVQNANIVFECIASGVFHFKNILAKSHIESSSALSEIINKLVKMDLIEHVCPINEKTNKQKGGYVISDPCIRFYYTFISKNESARTILDDNSFYDIIIKDNFEKLYVPKIFELISKQFLIRLNKLGKIAPLLLDIGTYWYGNPKDKKNGQFDIVGYTANGYVFFECKFTESKITDRVIEKELEEISYTTLKPIQYGFISKSGFDLKESYPYIFFSLEDMYGKL